MNWSWHATPDPLTPQAAVGVAKAMRLLRDRLRNIPEDCLSSYSAAGSRDFLVVFGPAERLPWVPGIAYAAPTLEAPALWLPTTLSPDVPIDLLARAVCERRHRSPMLLWPEPRCVIPLDRQWPVTREFLDRIAEAL